MGRIYKANARIKHHSIYGAGITFSVPSQEDFTATGTASDGLLWSKTDLFKNEFGINKTDKKLSLRIEDEVKQIDLWSNPISKTMIVTGTGTYSVAQIPCKNGKINLIDFRLIVGTTQVGASTVSPYNPLEYDYLVVDGGQIVWKPSGSSYSFASTANYSGSFLPTGEFGTFFGWNVSGTTASYVDINITQTGGTIRSVYSILQYKKVAY